MNVPSCATEAVDVTAPVPAPDFWRARSLQLLLELHLTMGGNKGSDGLEMMLPTEGAQVLRHSVTVSQRHSQQEHPLG